MTKYKKFSLSLHKVFFVALVLCFKLFAGPKNIVYRKKYSHPAIIFSPQKINPCLHYFYTKWLCVSMRVKNPSSWLSLFQQASFAGSPTRKRDRDRGWKKFNYSRTCIFLNNEIYIQVFEPAVQRLLWPGGCMMPQGQKLRTTFWGFLLFSKIEHFLG